MPQLHHAIVDFRGHVHQVKEMATEQFDGFPAFPTLFDAFTTMFAKTPNGFEAPVAPNPQSPLTHVRFNHPAANSASIWVYDDKKTLRSIGLFFNGVHQGEDDAGINASYTLF